MHFHEFKEALSRCADFVSRVHSLNFKYAENEDLKTASLNDKIEGLLELLSDDNQIES